VVAADTVTDDNHLALIDCRRARIPLIVRCSQPIPADRMDTSIGHSRVVLVDRSLRGTELGRLLDGLCTEPQLELAETPGHRRDA
jgi:hypothetical protein